jgi:hypothetical protein
MAKRGADIVQDSIQQLLQVGATVKVFHWYTKTHSAHVASDELHESISSDTDKFVEALMGLTDVGVNKIKDVPCIEVRTVGMNNDVREFTKYLCQVRERLDDPKNPVAKACTLHPHLNTIKDDILLSIDKAIFISRMS